MDPHFQTPSPLPLHFNTVPSITLAANLPSVYSLVPDILETLGNFPALLGLPTPPPTSAPLKSPLNSVVMQTVNLRRVRARCWLRRGWVSNAAITSGGDSGWIIIKASPLPLMWTCLINTRLLGGTRQMNRRRMIGKGVALLIHPPAECFVTMPQDRERYGVGWECTQFRKKEEGFIFSWAFIQWRMKNCKWCSRKTEAIQTIRNVQINPLWGWDVATNHQRTYILQSVWNENIWRLDGKCPPIGGSGIWNT